MSRNMVADIPTNFTCNDMTKYGVTDPPTSQTFALTQAPTERIELILWYFSMLLNCTNLITASFRCPWRLTPNKLHSMQWAYYWLLGVEMARYLILAGVGVTFTIYSVRYFLQNLEILVISQMAPSHLWGIPTTKSSMQLLNLYVSTTHFNIE